jgi:predicted N-acetyltransferase YhbS
MNAPASVRFRLATPADRPRLISMINAAFAVESFLESTRTDDVRLAAVMEKGEILVAENDAHHLIASIYMETRGDHGYLGMLAVDPAHQRSGLGSRLMQAAEDRFRQQGFRAIEITVLSLRPELPPIYSRFGYVATGTEEFRSPQRVKEGHECHCIVMTKPL